MLRYHTELRPLIWVVFEKIFSGTIWTVCFKVFMAGPTLNRIYFIPGYNSLTHHEKDRITNCYWIKVKIKMLEEICSILGFRPVTQYCS